MLSFTFAATTDAWTTTDAGPGQGHDELAEARAVTTRLLHEATTALHQRSGQ